MLKVAITGNIASGKSCVEAILSSKGFDVYDTDSIAHDILSTSFKVREAFNDFDISNYKGEISREKLGRVVFLNPEKKKVLESIIHPEVKNELNRIFEFNSGKEFVFVAIPLLFEAHFEDLFDKSCRQVESRVIATNCRLRNLSYLQENGFKQLSPFYTIDLLI